MKINKNEDDFEVFRKYMEMNGWKENREEQLGSMHVFEKGGQQKRVLGTQVKTAIVNGRLNLSEFFGGWF
ncbi:MAG: hypothetical protein ACM3MK_02055 [Chitinophagales bacterium]